MLFDDTEFEELAKRVFGYPAGKVSMRAGLVKMIGPHETYCEAFCGSAGVFFQKARSKVEVLADKNRDVVGALKAMKSITTAEGEQLKKMDWRGSKATFEKVSKSTPKTKVEKLYRFLYLAVFSYMNARKSFSPDREGVVSKIAGRAIKAKARLKGVKIEHADYEKVIKAHDSKDTFFYLDPPYPGANAGVGEKEFDEERFMKVLKSIKGKFVCTYGVKGKADFTGSGFAVQKVETRRTLANAEGVGREKILSTLIVSNFKAPTYKAFEGTGADVEDPRTLPAVATAVTKSSGGIHSHVLDRGNKETAMDGAHSHVYSLPAGKNGRRRLAYTLYDGPHEHKIAKEDSDETKSGGKHRHKIRIWQLGDDYLESALMLNTDPADGHTHKLLVDYTAADGMHEHGLTLPDGTQIKSLTPGEFAAQLKKNDSYLEFPVEGEQVAALKMRMVGDIVKADLWFDNGGHALGWSLDVQKGPIEVSKGEELAESFSVSGSRHTKQLTEFVDAEPLGKVDTGILRVDGEVKGGHVLHSDAGLIEHGVHTDFEHEYFLTKGVELVGILDVVHAYTDGWQARIRKDNLLPTVLSDRAVEDHVMPPDGCSGLPSSIEKEIPEELRYWEFTGEEAREVRDLLVASEMIKSENVAIVDGEFRLVKRSIELFEMPGRSELATDWQVEMLKRHSGREVTEAFNIGAVGDDDSIVFVDLCDVPAEDIAASVNKLAASSRDFAISCVDSERAREAMQKAGRTFRVIPEDPRQAIEVSKRVFVASFPLVITDDVRWLGEVTKADEPQERPDLEAEIAQHSSEIKFVEVGKADEERFVLGIVLEPETTDSQDDIYSAEEIRKAAHGFMLKARNIGLQHKEIINGKVSILESYVAPSDLKIGKAAVKKGTWLMGTRVNDKDLWASVKKGELTGYSIGGTAVRTAVT